MSSAGVLLAERYLIDRLLGQGGFAAVYRATDQALGRTVAIKVLHPDFARDEEARALFLHEARTSATLEHPHILGLHDVGTLAQRLLVEVPDRRGRSYEQYYPQVCYIVMPHIAGGSLADHLHGTPLPPQVALHYLGQIAAALDFAHARGIVHRDLKPQNLLLREADNHLLLADFGIARLLSGTRSVLNTRAVGTPHYMAPEQFEGRVATASDRYAFGCIAYQLLTGSVPFPLEDQVALMRAHTTQVVPQATARIAACGGQLPDAVDAVLAQALAKQPEDRQPTATAIVAGLAAALQATTPLRSVDQSTAQTTPLPILPTPLADPTRQLPAPTLIAPTPPWMPIPPYHVSDAIPAAQPPARRNRPVLWFGLLGGGTVLILLLALLANGLRAAGGVATATSVPIATRPQIVAAVPTVSIATTPVPTATATIAPTAPAAAGLPSSTSTVLQGYSGSVLALAWSPDGRTLASASNEHALQLWDLATGLEINALRGYTDRVFALAWSPDGRTLASGSEDKNIRLWDSATGKQTAIFQGHTGSVLALAWSPDGRTLASGSVDNTVQLWDPATGKNIATFQGHTNTVNAVAWSPNGRTLASASLDQTIRLWDPTTGKNTATLQDPGSVNAVAWSPDGRTLASGSDDSAVRLWDPATGKSIDTLSGHTGSVNAVAWSPDGRTLASGSQDKTVRLWR